MTKIFATAALITALAFTACTSQQAAGPVGQPNGSSSNSQTGSPAQ